MVLEHLSSGAEIFLVSESNGYIYCRRRTGAPWQTLYSNLELDDDDADEVTVDQDADPMPLSDWLWCRGYHCGHRLFGSWQLDMQKSGVKLACVDDVDENKTPSLLTADGAVLKRCALLGFVDAPPPAEDDEDDAD